MVACKQKYCKFCVRPCFDTDGKFCFGHCKKSHLILYSGQEETMKYNEQPLFCYAYEPRKRKINY